MKIWCAKFILALIASVLIATYPTALRAETTGDAYLRLAQGITSLTYSDFIFQRPPDFLESNPDLKTSFEHLDRAMAVKTTLVELSELSNHPEPKVRTLAMMRLYNMEEPAALRLIFTLANDQASTFPSRSFLTADPANNRTLLSTAPMTISELSKLMLEQAGFPPLGIDEAEIEPMLTDWVGWYQYLYLRATGNTHPIRADRTAKMVAVRKKIDVLPRRTRAWMLLEIGTIDLHTNENRDPRENLAPLFATEEELIAAAKQLGPDVLLTFLRDGSRTGLRDPKCTGPKFDLGYKNDRMFIIDHVGELFRKQDAEALKSMGEFIAAADVEPEHASSLIREEIERIGLLKSSYSRGKALAALLDLCGDRESDFIVQIFFDVLSGSNSEQRAFISELERRKPKEWKITFRKIVDHSGFEHLDNLTVVYFAHLTAQLGKTSIPTYKDNRNLPIPDVRKRLRAYFGLPEVR